MRRRFSALVASPLLVAALFAGCAGSSPLTPDPDGGVALDLGAAAPDLSAAPDLAGRQIIPLEIGPIMLQPGEEVHRCVRFKLPTATAIDVVQIDGTLAPGSHHLVVYRSQEATEQPDIYSCKPLDTSKGDIPIFIAETADMNTMALPKGVAYRFEPGEMIRLEAHYINAGAQPLVGRGRINLTVGAAASYEKADIMFCGTVLELYQPGVRPGKTSLAPGFYKPPAGTKLFGLTTHQHQRGSLMTVDKSTSTEPGQNLIQGQPYDNPPFLVWDEQKLITFAPGEGLRWQCHYDNRDSRTYKFGQSAEKEEMCFFWGYYYPSAGRFLSMNDCWR